MKNRIAVKARYIFYLGSATLVIALYSTLALAFAALGSILGLWTPLAGIELVQTAMIPVAAIVTTLSIITLTYQIIVGHYKGMINVALTFVIGFSLLTFTFYPTFLPYPSIHDISTNIIATPPRPDPDLPTVRIHQPKAKSDSGIGV